MSVPEKCPQCGAGLAASEYAAAYRCGALVSSSGRFYNAGTCRSFSELRKPIYQECDQLAERVKRLEEAGEELRKASRTFLLTHVDDDDGNEDAMSIDQVNPESAVQWEDPPSAGEHARLRNAINGWCKAKVQP
jgi:hypothetical protein